MIPNPVFADIQIGDCEDLLLFKSLLLRLLQEYTDLAVPIRVSPGDQIMRARLMGRETDCEMFLKWISAVCGSFRKRSAIHPARNSASE